MQSTDRAALDPNSPPADVLVRLHETRTKGRKKGKGWRRYSVPEGRAEQAFTARAQTVIPWYVVSGIALVGWPLALIATDMHGGIRLLLVLGAALPPIVLSLQSRVSLAGEIKAVDRGRYYQSIDPYAPRIGMVPPLESQQYVYHQHGQTWVAYPSPMRWHHSLVILVETNSPLRDNLPEIDKATWQRMRWLGIRYRPKSQSPPA